MIPAIQVHDLTVAYGTHIALSDADFAAPAGRLTGIFGPNGSGKSTLLKAILGLVPVAAGRVLLFGEPMLRQRQRLAYVPQRGTVDWDFPATVFDVALMGTYAKLGWFRRPGRVERTIAKESLARVGLDILEHRQISELSGGQQQRMFLARALAQRAEILILDEPFQGVDAATEADIIAVLRELRNDGKTIIAVHHDLHTAKDYFEHALLLNRKVLAEGPAAEVLSEKNLAIAFSRALPING
jgi:manganese/zinc/iron transport system ATP- binding protein